MTKQPTNTNTKHNWIQPARIYGTVAANKAAGMSLIFQEQWETLASTCLKAYIESFVLSIVTIKLEQKWPLKAVHIFKCIFLNENA